MDVFRGRPTMLAKFVHKFSLRMEGIYLLNPSMKYYRK